MSGQAITHPPYFFGVQANARLQALEAVGEAVEEVVTAWDNLISVSEIFDALNKLKRAWDKFNHETP